jgi:hypothetical protein
MVRDELVERLRKKPFQAFRINTVDGKQYDVVKPFTAAAMDTRMFLVLPNRRWTFLPFQQVANFEDVKPNGGRARPTKRRRRSG